MSEIVCRRADVNILADRYEEALEWLDENLCDTNHIEVVGNDGTIASLDLIDLLNCEVNVIDEVREFVEEFACEGTALDWADFDGMTINSLRASHSRLIFEQDDLIDAALEGPVAEADRQCRLDGMLRGKPDSRQAAQGERIGFVINGQVGSASCFAYDGCHKIYVCDTDEGLRQVVGLGYDLRPIQELPATWEGSCPLRFVESADLERTYVAQGEPASFVGFDIDESLAGYIDDLNREICEAGGIDFDAWKASFEMPDEGRLGGIVSDVAQEAHDEPAAASGLRAEERS